MEEIKTVTFLAYGEKIGRDLLHTVGFTLIQHEHPSTDASDLKFLNI